MADWLDIPLTGDPYNSVDEAELDAISALVQDAYVNELDHTIKRPGLEEFIDLGTASGVDGLYWSDLHQKVIAVSGGSIFKVTDFAGTVTPYTGDALSAGTRVSFTEDGTRVLMANGGRMVYIDPSAAVGTYIADPNAPTAVSHVDYLDGYIQALPVESDSWQWSDFNDMLAWNPLSTASAEGNPDKLRALKVGWREIFLPGRQTSEIWVPDGTNPFSRLQGGFIETGCSAPYTLQKVGNFWTWLDHRRRFVQLNNRTPTDISIPYDKVIQGFTSVDDAISDVIEMEGQTFYVVTFPSAGKTLVYNEKKKSWQEWSYWNSATAENRRHRMQSYCYAQGWNLHLVGDQSNGKIYKMSRSFFDDDGTPIRTVRRTGFIGRGTSAKKQIHRLKLTLKRGVATAAVPNPTLIVRYRDKPGAWKATREIDLGAVGHEETTIEISRLGIYTRRQWEIIHSDATDFILIGAQEFTDVLAT